MGSFSANIQKWVEKTGIKGALVVKKLAFDGFRGVVMKSPVDTGRFRGSWRIGVQTVDLTTEPEVNTKSKLGVGLPPSGAEAKQLANLENIKWGDRIAITNNVPYGPALEIGHSQQAPAGMLNVTFEEIKAGLDRTVRSVQ